MELVRFCMVYLAGIRELFSMRLTFRFYCWCFITGQKFGIKSFIGTITLPFIVLLTNSWEPWTDNPLLGALLVELLLG